MNAASARSSPQPWTCPFCALLCDGFHIDDGAGGLSLADSRCPRAAGALAACAPPAPDCTAQIDGRPADPTAAIAAAAALLASSRQPLFTGLATDVAGARALYALADSCHAILDHAHGDALMAGLRALQDRGGIQVTLSEIRSRADLLVWLGTQPSLRYPEFFTRCGIGSGGVADRRVLCVGVGADPALQDLPAAAVETIELAGDWFDTLAQLNAAAAGGKLAPAAGVARLWQRLQQARYAALIWEPAQLPAPAELLIESIQHLLKRLNRSGRAGGLALGGNDGALAVNQAVTWLSGLPLRTALHPAGLAHEPLRFATARLLDRKAVDCVLHVASFGPHLPPPATAAPLIVLGHPALADRAAGAQVFIPVATPGVDAAGHLFRVDNVVMIPLAAARASALPTVAAIAAQMRAQMLNLR